MKHNAWMLMTAAFLALPAMAQELRARVPFDFTVGTRHMAAGDYSLSRIRGPDSNYLLLVLNRQTKQSAVLLASGTAANEALQAGGGKVVFRCAEGVCAIVQVHAPSEGMAHTFPGFRKRIVDREMVAIQLRTRSETD